MLEEHAEMLDGESSGSGDGERMHRYLGDVAGPGGDKGAASVVDEEKMINGRTL